MDPRYTRNRELCLLVGSGEDGGVEYVRTKGFCGSCRDKERRKQARERGKEAGSGRNGDAEPEANGGEMPEIEEDASDSSEEGRGSNETVRGE